MHAALTVPAKLGSSISAAGVPDHWPGEQGVAPPHASGNDGRASSSARGQVLRGANRPILRFAYARLPFF